MTMTDCNEIFGLLSQYLDAELPEDMCRQIDAHISGCAPCVEFLESLKKSIEICHTYKNHERPGPLPAAAREELLTAYQKMMAARKAGPTPLGRHATSTSNGGSATALSRSGVPFSSCSWR
jgi:anti-sigma factor RsiW